MKRFFALGLVILFALPILTTTFAFAIEDENEAETTTTSQTAADEKEKDDSGDDSMRDRWERYKKDYKVSLNFVDKLRIKNRCKGAQNGQISRVRGRFNGIQTSRSKVHANVLKQLENVATKLKAAGLDTTELEASIATLKTKIDTFNTDLAAYKQALSDLAEIDCTTEPEGFKASLEAARASLDKVKADAKDIRAYVKDTIKPQLVKLRTQIEAKQEGDN